MGPAGGDKGDATLFKTAVGEEGIVEQNQRNLVSMVMFYHDSRGPLKPCQCLMPFGGLAHLSVPLTQKAMRAEV